MEKDIYSEQKNRSNIGKRLYTLKEAADYLGRPVWSIRELIWSGRIPSIKHTGERKIYLDILDLEDYVNHGKHIYEFKG